MATQWPSFRGTLLLGDAAAAACGGDFGRMVSTAPRAALRAADADDVHAAVGHARATGMRVIARGEGHTTRGQSHHDDALVLDLRGLDEIAEPHGHTIRVGAGARWKDVVARTCAAGLTPPVLTDYLDLSVGGTLSVGGVGGQSFRHGLQVDNVLDLEVVTGRGERVRCSATHEPELFAACRGGLGQSGIIVAATLALVPAPDRVRVRHLPYPDLHAFLSGQIELALADTTDYLVGNLHPPTVRGPASAWSLSLECVEYLGPSHRQDDPTRADEGPPAQELAYLDYVTRLDAMVRAWRDSGAWLASHPWIDLFLPADAAADVIAMALDSFDADELGDGYVMTYPLLGARLGAPAPRVPHADAAFLFDVLPSVPAEHPERLAAAERRCERIFEAAIRTGATVYPIGFPLGTSAMGSEAWARQLGEHHATLLSTRERHDPHGVIGSGLFWP